MNLIAVTFLASVLFLGAEIALGIDPTCMRPPPIVNPHQCCKDPQPNGASYKCSAQVGFPLPDPQNNSRPPTDVATAACFAECILKDMNYVNQNGQLNLPYIQQNLKQLYANDPDYIPVMSRAFDKCGPIAQQRLASIPSIPAATLMTKGCNPFSGIVLGCVYKEFFENCPSSKWTSNDECNSARDYFKKCSRPN